MSDIIQQAISQLRSEEYETWIQGWRTLFYLRDTEPIDELLIALGDAHSRVRDTVAFTLGQIPDIRSVGPLINTLTDPVDEISGHAAWALGETGDLRAVEPLIQVLEKPSSPNTQRFAIESLAKFGDKRAVEPLIGLLKETYYARLATILGNLGDCRAVEPLLQTLKTNPDPKKYNGHYPVYRYYAVRALGKLNDERALPLLKQIHEQDTQPVLKGKSVSDMAKVALSRIQERQMQAEPGAV